MRLFAHQVQHAQLSFPSEGHHVPIELFSPAARGRYPAVIALHGSGGLHRGGFADPARLLSASGFAVFVPHYFERTGTGWASDTIIRQEFPTWMQTISDTITFAASQPQTDACRIALLGFSLGAYRALSVAARDERVKAVVEYFGGLPEDPRDLPLLKRTRPRPTGAHAASTCWSARALACGTPEACHRRVGTAPAQHDEIPKG